MSSGDDFHRIMAGMGAPSGYHGQRRRGNGLGPVVIGVAVIIIVIAVIITVL